MNGPAMKREDFDNLVPKAARGEFFYFLARASMLFATLVALPIAGWMLNRIIAQQDLLAHTVMDQTIALKVMSATVKDKLDANVSSLADHELRIRALEKARNDGR